jgi:hypothetical protein
MKITKAMLPKERHWPGRTALTTTATWITNGHWCIRRSTLDPVQAALADSGRLGQSLGVEDVKALGGNGADTIESRINGWADLGCRKVAVLRRTEILLGRPGQPAARGYLGGNSYAFADDAHLDALGKPETLRLLPPEDGRAFPLLLQDYETPTYLLAPCGDFRTKELHELVALLPVVGA